MKKRDVISSISLRYKKVVVLVILFWLIIIISTMSVKLFTRITGDEVLLKVNHVDSNDPTKGYIKLRYDISDIDINALNPEEWDFKKGDTIYVTLSKEGRFCSISNISSKPVEGLFIKGKVKEVNGESLYVEYGMEDLFIKEDLGNMLSGFRAWNIYGKVAIDRFGNSIIKSIILIYDELEVELK